MKQSSRSRMFFINFEIVLRHPDFDLPGCVFFLSFGFQIGTSNGTSGWED